MVIAQLPFSKWNEYINEQSLADARLDRLTFNVNRVERKGESMRRKYSNRLNYMFLKHRKVFPIEYSRQVLSMKCNYGEWKETLIV
jgi:hypothetical protein